MVRVLIPWKMGLYDNLNGYHPLVASFVDATPKNVEFVVAERGGADGRGSAQVVYQFMRASRKFGSLPVESFPRISDDDFLVKWVLTRDPPAQMYLQTLEEQVDLVLHHTTPVHMTSIPFVCHVENFTTLFFPFLQMGATAGVALRSQPIFELIKWQLESDLCRGIFTHLKSCHQMLVSCFNSEKIARKSRYIPLGVAASPSFQKAIDRKFQEMPRRKGLRVLFTNSAHSGVANFHLRGGAELLVAFGRLVKTFPDAKLTIVSTRPADESLRDYPMANVVWLDQGITDDRLYDLLLEADVFALPAAGLHSYSALRAMKFGAVLICSDAPGYDEYVVDNETGFVVSVKPKDVYQPDPETGWMRDDYSAGFKLSPPIAADLTRLLDMLARDSSERHRVALAARKQVDTRHALQPWVTGIADFLEEARQKPR